MDAEGWLRDERTMIASGEWIPPKRRAAVALAAQPPKLGEYSASGSTRVRCGLGPEPITPSSWTGTSSPALGEYRLTAISPLVVRSWHAALDPTTPTYRAHAYSLLRTIMGTAVSEQLVTINPCVIRGGSSSKTVHKS